jgi:outer membrane protein assembly factor BamB
MRFTRKTLIAMQILGFSVLLIAGCSDGNTTLVPTRWMGPLANGHYPGEGLLKEWPEEGPEIRWIFDSLGIGFASAAIQDDYLYTTGMEDTIGYLYKLNLSGDLIYRIPYGSEWTGSYPGSRGTPTLAGKKGYLVSGMGKLVCFNTADGKINWTRDYFSEFGGDNIIWGIAENPVVEGNVIYATPGGSVDNVVALDRHSGDIIWSCSGESELSAYCTPLIFEHNGRSLLTTYSASHLLGIDRESGELLWSVDVPREWSVHHCTPIYKDGEIFYATGNEVGGGKLKLSDDGNNATVLWENGVCDYRVSAIHVDGFIYGSFSDYDSLTWRCIKWDTGEETYATRRLKPGRSLFADGMLYIYTYQGELALVRPDPSEFNVVSETRVKAGSGLHLAQPVMHGGILYVRHGSALIAYNI